MSEHLDRRHFIGRHIKSIAAIGAAAIVTKVTAAKASVASCFLRGTKILTPEGELPIEQLEIDDWVETQRGPRSIIQMHRFYSDDNMPVCIHKSAIADNVPNADLYVTPGHGIYIDGMVIGAGGLINNRSIEWAHWLKTKESFHLELSNHDAVYAHGLSCESFAEFPSVLLAKRRQQIKSHVRSAMAPFIDIRKPEDVVRDRLMMV
jgi:hypothetical protein